MAPLHRNIGQSMASHKANESHFLCRELCKTAPQKRGYLEGNLLNTKNLSVQNTNFDCKKYSLVKKITIFNIFCSVNI